MSQWSPYDGRAKCPFWKEADAKTRTLRCESFLEGSSCKICFERKRDMEEQIQTKCAADFRTCALFRIVWAKYEEPGVER